MPGLTRKLLIFAAVDGLFIQAAGQRAGDDRNAGVRIEYGSNKITAASEQNETLEGTSLEAHGIVGARRRSSTARPYLC